MNDEYYDYDLDNASYSENLQLDDQLNTPDFDLLQHIINANKNILASSQCEVSDDSSSSNYNIRNEDDELDDYPDEADSNESYYSNMDVEFSDDESADENYEQLLALDEKVIKRGLSETEIKKFPTCTYLSSDCAAKPENSCVICISPFEIGETIREIVCGHEFHRDCIDKWLSCSIKCPTCNKYLR